VIDPLAPDADLAWLQSWRGIDRGMPDIWAARIQARLDKAAEEAATARRSAVRAWQTAADAQTSEHDIRDQAGRVLRACARFLDGVDPLAVELRALAAEFDERPDSPVQALGEPPALTGGAAS
jgi:hypothetical protein